MATLQEVNELRQRVQDLVTLGVRDITDLMRSLAGEDPQAVAAMLSEVLPAISDPYATAIGDLSTDFYLTDRAQQGVTKPFAPPDPVIPDLQRVTNLARWGVAPLFAPEPDATAALSRLSGGVTGLLGNVQRETTLNLAQTDPSEGTRWQRMAMPGCCAFCALLASRGAAYRSKEAAERSVGRGVPVEKTQHRRGGQGKGIRARGNGQLGVEYHANCRCVAVALHDEHQQELDAAAQEYFNAYWDAYEHADKVLERNTISSMDAAGNRHNEYEWVHTESGDIVSPEARTKIMLAEMRKILGTH